MRGRGGGGGGASVSCKRGEACKSVPRPPRTSASSGRGACEGVPAPEGAVPVHTCGVPCSGAAETARPPPPLPPPGKMRASRAGLRRALQLTLAVVKPDAVAHPLVLQAVHETILKHKFLIVRTKDLLWSKEDSQRFYQEHSGRFFYQRLVEFMSSGPMRVYILAHEEAITGWRSLMGPTKVYRARHVAPESIRGSLGLTDTRNTVHGSDSAASASKEIAFFFPDFCQEEWYQREEPQLRREMVGAHGVIGCQLKDGSVEQG